MKKKIIITLAVLATIIAVASIILYVNKDKKIEVSVIDTIDLGEAKTEADKVELVKNNIVKIVNKVDNGEIIGTGFFDKDGYLITNSHIVDIKGDLTVIYNDNSTAKAKLVSNNINSDIALLAVESPKALALKTISTLDLKVTDNLYAIGFSLNLDGEATTTKGILSARRSAGGVEYLQTDASMENGSSGGPLINRNGELVGMNSFSTTNSNISMAISTESLLREIKDLKENKKVNYLEGERQKNTLSVVLEEIGYHIEDIYNEKKYYKNNETNKEEKDEVKIEEEKNQNNIQNEYQYKANSDSSLKQLVVENYDIGFSASNTSYYVTLKNDETNLSISALPNANTSKVTISGNENFKEGNNQINITVTSEANTTTKYTITVVKPLTYFEGINGILCVLDVQKYNGVNSFVVSGCDFIDSDRVRLYSNYQLDVVKNVTINVYAGWNSGKTSGLDTNGKEIRFLKTYNFTPTYSYNIPLSDIRQLLNDDDYEGGVYEGADLTFDIQIETRKQGIFKESKPWGLSK